jgi:hypothetical protein
MPVKKNASPAKKSKNVAGKRHAKLVAPKGEKMSSMKAYCPGTHIPTYP